MSLTHATERSDPVLAIIPTVGMVADGDRVFLDIKAVEGLFLYAKLWPGRVRCISRSVPPARLPYGQWYGRASLPFDVVCLPELASAETFVKEAQDARLILAGADGRADIGIVAAARNIPVVLIIEYTLQTRLDMLRLTPGRTRQKLKTAIWLRATERARRSALRNAAGLQANGTPAFEAYGRSNRSPLLYFDTRLKKELFIGLPAAEARATAVTASKELRLAFSGRLDAVKGAEYLVPVLAALHRRGVTRATLDIYGDGGLRTSIAAQAQAAGLENHVRLHGPVPYEQVLVPAFRDTVDLFLCCHPQADPSCTYLETLGCGVPIAGFCNDAFKGVLALGACGVGVPIGDVEGLAGTIACLDADRTRLAALTRGAASVASQHLFESVFAQRVAHLRGIAGL